MYLPLSYTSSSLTWFVCVHDPTFLVSGLLFSREGSVPHTTWLPSVSVGAQAVPHMSSSRPPPPLYCLSVCACTIAVSVLPGQDQTGNSSVLWGFSTASCLSNTPHDTQLPVSRKRSQHPGHQVTGFWGQHLTPL